jgi:hypothetical protein
MILAWVEGVETTVSWHVEGSGVALIPITGAVKTILAMIRASKGGISGALRDTTVLR